MNYLIDDEEPNPKKGRLFTICVWLAILLVVVAFYALAGKGVVQETHPEYRQFMDTSFHQSDYEPFPRYQVLASITAYTPRVEETDSTPFITASGETVRNGIIANNCLPLHSVVEIEGNKYVVLDRMNSRYGCGFYDIFMWDLDEALNWGVRRLPVLVY